MWVHHSEMVSEKTLARSQLDPQRSQITPQIGYFLLQLVVFLTHWPIYTINYSQYAINKPILVTNNITFDILTKTNLL